MQLTNSLQKQIIDLLKIIFAEVKMSTKPVNCVDARTELAELVKRKAEISVSRVSNLYVLAIVMLL